MNIVKVIVINIGWEQEPLINELRRRKDVELYGIHPNNEINNKTIFKEILISDLRDLIRILDFSIKITPNVVISDQCDYGLYAQAFLAEYFNLPGQSILSAKISNDKYIQRQKCEKYGINIPKYKLCNNLKDAELASKEIGFPLIIKPTDNRGSFGVEKVNNILELEKGFFSALKNSISREILIEEFIDGQQITIDGYSFPINGIKSLAIGSKLMSDNNEQVSLGIAYPASIDKELFKKAIKNNEKVNRSLGYHFGMIHSEYMIREDTIYLIESTNRGGGVFTSEIIAPESSGIDLINQYISDCFGNRLDFYKKPLHKEIVLRFFSFSKGKVKNIKNWEVFKNSEGIVSAELSIKNNQIIKKETSDANRHGFFIYRGNLLKANQLMKKVIIEYYE